MKNLTIKLALLTIMILGIIGVAACDKGSDGKDKPAPAAKAPATKAEPADKAHAAATVVAGSHEDWCDEHQVPESQCTKCNPELIPAFQATNDWCEEHGMPESQCTKCNPEIVIARPPKKD